MSLSPAAKAQLPAVAKFIDAVSADPSQLNDPAAAKVKSWVESFGGSVPEDDVPGLDAEEEEDVPDLDVEEQEDVPDLDTEEEEEEEEEEEPDEQRMSPESSPFPDMPSGEAPEDGWEKAGEHKAAAQEAKANGDYATAVNEFTEALKLAPSALSFANRADCLLRQKRPMACVGDCDAALQINPDSAKALKIRGKAHRFLGNWEKAQKDLAAANQIDFDPDLQELCKFVESKMKKVMEKQRKQREKAERERQQKLAQRKKANEEARRRQAEEDAAAAAGMGAGMGGMPGGMGGMPGGMGGMGGMPGMGGAGMGGMPGMGGAGMGGMGGLGDLLNDPEIAASLQNPKVMEALSSMMGGGGDPSKIMQLMSDPEVGPVLQKLMSKFGGGMGGMPGTGGGMGFAPDMEGGEVPDLDPTEEASGGDEIPDLD